MGSMMESVTPQSAASGLGEYVQFGKRTFKNATNQLQKVTDPAGNQKFDDNCVVFNPTAEEQKDRFQAEFSDFAMTGSPVISDVKQEVYGQAETATGKFFDGTWRYQTADVTYDFTKNDLKNVSSLLKFSGQSGGAQEAANRFLKNLQLYPGGYFSRFPQYGALSMNLRA